VNVPQHIKNELVLDAHSTSVSSGNNSHRQQHASSRTLTHAHQHAAQQQVVASRPSNGSSETSLASNHLGANVVKKILLAANSGQNSTSSSLMELNGEKKHHRNGNDSKDKNKNNAAAFARTAPRAGYLHKIGGGEYKRRFFVLKPSTHLYYFDTPGDADPRGCVDLEDAQIRELETLEDGRFRFEILLHNDQDGGDDGSNNNKVILEARNKVVGQEWIETLKEERLSYSKQCIRRGEARQKELESEIRDLRKEIENYRMMERERDDAVQDSNDVRRKLKALNEGVRLLTRQMSRAPKTASSSSSSKSGKNSDYYNSNDANEAVDASTAEAGSFASVPEEEHRIKELDLGDTNFGALSNACYMIRENLRLTSEEANSAIDDIHKANAETAAVQKRMKKAEKLLTKLWEENCTMREQLKQIKQEKKELGEKVRTLVDAAEESQRVHATYAAEKSLQTSNSLAQNDEAPGILGEREQTLLRELEEHIATSLRLHQKFLSANSISLPNSVASKSPTQLNQSVQSSDYLPNVAAVDGSVNRQQQQKNDSTSESVVQQCKVALQDVHAHLVTDSDNDNGSSINQSGGFSPMKPRDILADLDTSGMTDADEMTAPLTSTDGEPANNRHSKVRVVHGVMKQNPLLVLDEVDKRELGQAGSLMSTNSSISSVTDNWRATTRIGSTTADTSGLNDVEENGPQVYHLTFHSQKIGLQFQKVPASSFTRGTLSDVISSDIAHKTDTRDLIDAPSPNRGLHRSNNGESTLNVATPVDAVLVCGFRGFDVTRNDRPKLGARLVGFDGMSIERGRWTFSSVRNAIQTRDRPLTMSFRNDYLNPDQRSILERAVRENDRGERQSGNASIQPSSRFSGGTGYSDHYVSPLDGLPPRIQRTADNNMRGSAEAAARLSSPANKDYMMRRNVDKNGYSFSDAASGSILSSTFAPLMAGLMSGFDQTHENYVDTQIPQYLRPNESSSSANGNSRRIKDFTDELL